MSAGGLVDGRAGDLGLVLKTTNRKAASPVARTSLKKVLTRSKWGCGTSSCFSSHVRLCCRWNLGVDCKVHKHPLLHLANRGRGERLYVIQELGNLLLDAKGHPGEVIDIIFFSEAW